MCQCDGLRTSSLTNKLSWGEGLLLWTHQPSVTVPDFSNVRAAFAVHKQYVEVTLYVSYTLDVRSWLLLILIPPHRPWLPQKGHHAFVVHPQQVLQ